MSSDVIYVAYEDDLVVIYLALPRILRLYGHLMRCTPQQARDQLRSPEGLEGALCRPQWYAHFQSADLPLQSAVLAHGIAETQPFVEGNKRIALAAMLLFLEINGCFVEASQEMRKEWMIGLSQDLTPEDLAQQIRTNSRFFFS